MRIIRFFKNSITGKLTLCLLIFLILIITALQAYSRKTYHESLKNDLVTIETKNLRMQSESLQSMISPIVSHLYDQATDIHAVAVMHDAIGSEKNSKTAKYELLNILESKTLAARWLRGLVALYGDGEFIAFEKAHHIASLRRDSNLTLRQTLFNEARAQNVPVSIFHPEDRLVTITVPAISVQYPRSESQVCLTGVFDFSFLKNFFAEVDTDYTCSYMTDSDGIIISCADDSLLGASIDDILPGSGKEIIMKHPVNTIGWNLCMRVDTDILLANISGVSNSISFLYIFAAILLVVISLISNHRFLLPMRKMSEAMVEAGRGNLKVRVPISGSNELWQTVRGFNYMMDRLDGYYETNMRYYQKLLDVERRKNHAEMAMLESHINAHFLYNTLNVINYQALELENYQVSKSIKRLSNIMRYAFNSRMKNVRLFQEAAWVEQYLEMQKERLGDRLSYDISISDDIADWPFRKMMLQPFVENAIIHGIDGVNEALILVIADQLPDGRLGVRISDNARGMDEETAQRIRRILDNPTTEYAGGIGISNVAERIYAFFGPEAEILLETAPGKGTCFTLKLPMPNGDELKYGFLEEEEDDEIY